MIKKMSETNRISEAHVEAVEKVAAAVLYEGYLLWPYRRSAQKNQKRWTFGGIYPRSYSETVDSNDPWLHQTECLVVGEAPCVTVKVRFLQVVERQAARLDDDGRFVFVDELEIGEERFLSWDEAAERHILVEGLELAHLESPRYVPIAITAGSQKENLQSLNGSTAGALVRCWHDIQGMIEISAAKVDMLADRPVYRLRIQITNTTPWNGQSREATLRDTLVSTHTILTVTGGEFTSLTNAPRQLIAQTERCLNIRTWPVLAGDEGSRHTMLSSPIILADYPQIAPESPGDLFDGSEIDQLLVLNILSLTDEEKAEIRATDPKGREILERTEALTADDFMNLHGAIREFRRLDHQADDLDIPTWYEELEKPAPDSIVIEEIEIRPGSKVRLRPRPGGDIMDLALDGKVAFIETIEQDFDDRIHLTVTLEDDPGRKMGLTRQPGHRFFFAPEEVEPL